MTDPTNRNLTNVGCMFHEHDHYSFTNTTVNDDKYSGK